MAQVFKRAGGRKLEKAMALRPEVQSELKVNSKKIAGVASSVLAESEYDGHSFIETDVGKIDHYVVLNDTRGQAAAMTIEFGRKGDTRYRSGPLKGQPVAPMMPIAPLRTAIGVTGTHTGRR